jgi:hypothetical protein
MTEQTVSATPNGQAPGWELNSVGLSGVELAGMYARKEGIPLLQRE